MAFVMLLLRATPFILFGISKKNPEILLYLGKVTVPAAIAMLVVYSAICDITRETQKSFIHAMIPECMAIVFVIIMHYWKRNMLLSVFGGTIVYMLLLHWIA